MIRVFTAFSGYDSQCLALREVANAYDCGFRWELVGWSEIDKYAIKAHNALFPQWAERNYGDISKIDWETVPDFDLFTYSSPCQDFSQAGKQKGAEKGSGTRSSLLWECERAIRIKLPKYLLFENVSAVASKKFIKLFNSWQLTLEQMGYTNFTQILNAKTHGYPTPVPQNRERLFVVSILDCDQPFYFPDAQPLTQRLVGVLTDSADCYYHHYFTNDPTPLLRVLQLQWGETIGAIRGKSGQKIEPCWSVGRLIEIICNCHIITNQFMENWICCDKNTNLIELLIGDIEVYVNMQHLDFSKLKE